MFKLQILTIGVIGLMGCTVSKPLPTIIQQPLPYHQKLQLRTMDDVDTVVIHCTELPTLKLAREFGEQVWYASNTGNSGHYYIDRDGAIYQYVADERVANHTRGFNERSIGIELINVGRYPDWYHHDKQQLSESYSGAQITSLKDLLKDLQGQYPQLTTIAGHEDLDTALMAAEDVPTKQIRRKVDPGPFFPWNEVLAEVSLQRKTPQN